MYSPPLAINVQSQGTTETLDNDLVPGEAYRFRHIPPRLTQCSHKLAQLWNTSNQRRLRHVTHETHETQTDAKHSRHYSLFTDAVTRRARTNGSPSVKDRRHTLPPVSSFRGCTPINSTVSKVHGWPITEVGDRAGSTRNESPRSTWS